MQKSLKFLLGFVSTSFSLLGYLCAGLLSPNPFVWWLAIPLMLLIAIVDTLMMVAWIDEDNQL